jgi:hypothetical protein
MAVSEQLHFNDIFFSKTEPFLSVYEEGVWATGPVLTPYQSQKSLDFYLESNRSSSHIFSFTYIFFLIWKN